VAIATGIPHGGFVPRGRRAEDGRIDSRYQLVELASEDYDARTERNVVESDATLIVSIGPLKGGSLTTQRMARRHCRACLHVDLARLPTLDACERIRAWLADFDVRTLNVAGPRESTTPGIHAAVCELLREVFDPEPIPARPAPRPAE